MTGTVRWHTWGLDLAAHEWRTRSADGTWWGRWHPEHDVRRAEVAQLGGLVSVQAAPSLLSSWAVSVVAMADHAYEGMSYTSLGGPKWELCREDGEVQTFVDHRRRVSVAQVSRSEVLATAPPPTEPADLRPLIWARNDAVRSRRPEPRRSVASMPSNVAQSTQAV
ncbi:hypothetical protein [Nonomuraea zeae]|uniref:Uncharacterized protein n=1 Tax=Nonomuraea zeae TaxID=1642303 RepID=A0A5S4GA56_9ACTN|nr:hypothetical protein [Nonomuraea zeae]TMR29897.1 hypothetical protein ETD85_30735 [Nonomuraea zeae]